MKKETLYALLDDELDPRETEQALDEVLADPALQACWNRQQLLRAAISERDLLGRCDMVTRVSDSLVDEPEIMAPNNLRSPGEHTESANRVASRKRWGQRPLVYTGIAASLLALVWLGYQPQTPEPAAIAEQATPTAVSPDKAAMEQALQSMIVQHGEFSGAAALNGLVAYAKVVNGATDQRAP